MKKVKWVICDCCEGEGKVSNPAFENGFTTSEWNEMDLDQQSAYLGGDYDVTCTKCKGERCVSVPNIAALSFAEKRDLVLRRREEREEAQFRREAAAERAIGY
ncbi:hypothetical protein IPC1147_33965 [Pseudomonas aeruginosa]|uniref:hypothetical protein n=1 Tax=Pseudomonas aeruginosa TaxID=287 RepID=UPI000F51C608|nr:hypothetical protein [Pseudomonas aeruginosa]MBA5106158.1 hypothetical protein [Pseudomonas aeruginosa]MBD1300186.1 hypothetical protein [Pseudomonas aeruginosa]MBD1340831.1 hypothetical protein [Pseudomonas aeruginosa]MBG4604239.1 hypothetical protein [Pseudomonas aeruginosa]MBH3592926.1 hypothetical protein [Pseudomonas aeruginosa]